MARNRTKAYWLLLLTWLYTASIVLSVGETQARYYNTSSVTTYYQNQDSGVTSNYLITEKDPSMTVLLGEIPLTSFKEVNVWLKATGASQTGNLLWEIEEAYRDYLNLTMMIGPYEVAQNDAVDVLQDSTLDITMKIWPTVKAQSTAHEALKIQILVTWGDSMWATFVVDLPEVKEPPKEGEETDPSAPGEDEDEDKTPEGGNTSTDPGDGNTTAPETGGTTPDTGTSGGTETTTPDTQEKPNETQGAGTDPAPENQDNTNTENTQTGTETPQSEEVSAQSGSDIALAVTETGETGTETEDTDSTDTQNTGESEPTTDQTQETTQPTQPPVLDIPVEPTTEPATEPTETDPSEPDGSEPTESQPEESEPSESQPEESEPDTGETETPEEPEPEEPLGPVHMATLPSFDPSAQLPIKLRLDKTVTKVRLGLIDMDPEAGNNGMLPFPAGTRFSLNGGSGYYMLCSGYVLELTLNQMDALSILMDFSHVELDPEEELMLAVEGYTADGALLGSWAAGSTPDALQDYPSELLTLTQTVAETQEETQTQKRTPHILTHGEALRFTLPESWKDAELEYTVEMLTMTEDMALAYQQVDVVDGNLTAEYTNDDLAHTMTLQIADALPPAGTYRINMNWNYEGICYAQTQTTFFINYSAQSVLAQSSQEVPNNDD